jgi:hypothetical protein
MIMSPGPHWQAGLRPGRLGVLVSSGASLEHVQVHVALRARGQLELEVRITSIMMNTLRVHSESGWHHVHHMACDTLAVDWCWPYLLSDCIVLSHWHWHCGLHTGHLGTTASGSTFFCFCGYGQGLSNTPCFTAHGLLLFKDSKDPKRSRRDPWKILGKPLRRFDFTHPWLIRLRYRHKSTQAEPSSPGCQVRTKSMEEWVVLMLYARRTGCRCANSRCSTGCTGPGGRWCPSSE